MARIRCFLLEDTGQVAVSLRRYVSGSACPVHSYHDARFVVFNEPQERDEQGHIQNGVRPVPSHDDPRWPKLCDCGYAFQESDEWQRFTETVYRRSDTGEETTISNVPAGAMWYAWWYDHFCTPQGPHSLVVKTPGGDWVVDSQASNCTISDDKKQERHHCWVLHGQAPDVTVSKEGGSTCGAGAGSIQCGNYHGFLRNGYLED